MRKRLMAAVGAAVIATIWGVARADMPDESADADTMTGPPAAEHAESSSEPEAHGEKHPRLVVSARALKGRPLRDAENVRIGTIRGIVLERDGRASAVVVSAGGWLGWGRTRYRIVWEALDFLSTPGRIRTSSAAELQALPSSASHATRYKNKRQVRAKDILLRKVVLEDGTFYGTVRDVIFRLNGRLDGLVIVPMPRLSDRLGDRAPHVYREPFAITGDGRIALPYPRHCVPRSGSGTAARCNQQ
jgi:sporulation protein YlmC with PRC-barrel domain